MQLQFVLDLKPGVKSRKDYSKFFRRTRGIEGLLGPIFMGPERFVHSSSVLMKLVKGQNQPLVTISSYME